MIGFATHELGMGDTLLGIARVFQCCCTPEDIAVYTGWGGASRGVASFAAVVAGCLLRIARPCNNRFLFWFGVPHLAAVCCLLLLLCRVSSLSSQHRA